MKRKLSFIPLFLKASIQPTKVVRTVLDRDSNFFIWPMIIVYAAISTSSPFFYMPLLKRIPFPLALLSGFVLWTTVGILIFLVFVWIFYFVGKRLGGKGSFEKIRTAYVWSVPPILWGIIFLLISKFSIWMKVFGGETDMKILSMGPKPWWQIVSSLLVVFTDYWAWVLVVINTAYVHKFSIWKSLAIFLVLVIPVSMLFAEAKKYFVVHIG